MVQQLCSVINDLDLKVSFPTVHLNVFLPRVVFGPGCKRREGKERGSGLGECLREMKSNI